MYKNLKKLSSLLFNLNYKKFAQQVDDLVVENNLFQDDLDKDWEEAAAEFGSEPISEDEYLKNTLIQEDDVIRGHKSIGNEEAELILLISEKENFNISSFGGKTPVLGKGAFGTVIQGIYKGKTAAAKIVIDSKPEAKIWGKILQLIQGFPDKLKKHFPAIYHLNESYIYFNEKPFKYDIIIMEKLRPLPSKLYKEMEEYKSKRDLSHIQQEQLQKLRKDDDYLYEVAKLIFMEIKSSPYFRMDMRNFSLDLNFIFKTILEQNINNLESVKQAGRNVANIILNEYPFREKYRERIYNIVDNILRNSLSDLPGIPRSYYNIETPKYHHDYERYSPVWENLPETKELYEALLLLGSYGVKWFDLHNDNLMMGDDGNIKIIDVGLFLE